MDGASRPFRARFTRKLHVAFGTMLLVTLVLALYFQNSVKWFEYDVQRIALANDVLQDYQEVSTLTFRAMNALTERVLDGAAGDPQSWQADVASLRAALSEVRQGIAEEVAFEGPGTEVEELEALNEIERVVEDIIRVGDRIHLALEEARPEDARAELGLLRGQGVDSYVEGLIAAAVGEQAAEVERAESEVISLSRYIARLLPLVIIVLALFTAGVAWWFSRNLTRSVNALAEGAAAFSRGDLAHRIEDVREVEFRRLAQAFNTMADELGEHRATMRDANVRLEAMVDERTRALQQSNEKLEKVDENRRKLLAELSHEFRTPLTVIRGEAEIALRGKRRPIAEYRETLERIMEQADHTTRFVEDLLFIARADAGEPRLKVRPVSVAELLRKVCRDCAAPAKEREVTIEQSIADGNAVVMADAGRLRQVFTILLDNAVRYSHEGGVVEVSLSHGDKRVIIEVRDHGIGLSEEEARQVFERFYRAARAQQHAAGTGLGLPVAKAIVEAHGGHIRLAGHPEGGTLATVELPTEEPLKAVA